MVDERVETLIALEEDSSEFIVSGLDMTSFTNKYYLT